jgi:type IV pilus assembly protein PilB
MSNTKKKPVVWRIIGEVLVERGVISKELRDSCLKTAKLRRVRLGDVLVSDGFITQMQLAEALADQYQVELVDPEKLTIQSEALAQIPERIAKQFNILPVSFENDHLKIAVDDPGNLQLFNTLKGMFKTEFGFVVAPLSSLQKVIANVYSNVPATERKATPEPVIVREEKPRAKAAATAGENTGSVEDLVNELIESALKNKASDIHIEPSEVGVRVRHRIFGELREIAVLHKDMHSLVLARMKLLGNLDIAEKRHAQDGSFQFQSKSGPVDLRLSTLPTILGEKAVARILDRNAVKKDLLELGMSSSLITKVKTSLSKPYGIFLVTGPTGSGKTTSIYSLMNLFNKTAKNIVTIEDPIEYKIENINQVQANTKAGMSFTAALRSILRQDPDIIVIGEIRDRDTAEIAIRAALTGHLVISTLHTNDSVSTISRLMDMGIEPFLLASSILGILSQRLIRVLCPKCRGEGTLSAIEAELLQGSLQAGAKMSRPVGCANCQGLGFKGRQGIYEYLEPTPEVKQLITERKSEREILKVLNANGFTNMRSDGIDKIQNQITSVDEVLKQTL